MNIGNVGNSGSVRVVERGQYRVNGTHTILPLGAALAFHTDFLHEVCFSALRPLSHDFSVLLGAVKCADRSILRHHAKGWSRAITVFIPVFEYATWSEVGVINSLQNALNFVTGDSWRVRFTARHGKPESSVSSPLLIQPDRRRVFIPFSHGLDSFAQTQLLSYEDPSRDIIPIHLRSGKSTSMKRSLASSKGTPAPIHVSASVTERKHAEPSFRTRPFLFSGLAGYAATLSGGGNVVIPENGQGSLGGSLVRLGNEAPHRSCHPGFTTRLSLFLKALTGTEVTFEHPALFQTKGRVLGDLKKVQPNSESWLKLHSSCSYDSRHSTRWGKQVHCGVCGNCLLRRVALHAACIADVTPYKFANLDKRKFEESMEGTDLTRNIVAFRDVARNGVRGMHRLASLHSQADQFRIAGESILIARHQGLDNGSVRIELNNMLKQHGHEWYSFLEALGPKSWILEYAKG